MDSTSSCEWSSGSTKVRNLWKNELHQCVRDQSTEGKDQKISSSTLNLQREDSWLSWNMATESDYEKHHLFFSVDAEGLDSLLGDKACKELNLLQLCGLHSLKLCRCLQRLWYKIQLKEKITTSGVVCKKSFCTTWITFKKETGQNEKKTLELLGKLKSLQTGSTPWYVLNNTMECVK